LPYSAEPLGPRGREVEACEGPRELLPLRHVDFVPSPLDTERM
jgi:hypothetical protein